MSGIFEYLKVYQFLRGAIFTYPRRGLFPNPQVDQFHILSKTRPTGLAQYTNLASGSCAGISIVL